MTETSLSSNLGNNNIGIDKSVNKTSKIEYANCITAREDRGVSNRKSEGTAVIVQNPHGFNKGGEFENCTTITSHSWECNNFVKQSEDQQYVNNISDEYSFVKRKAQEILDNKGAIPNMFNAYDNYEIRDYAPTQTTSCNRASSSAAVLKKETNFRIRKLTPKECWRLMGFSDKCFEVAKYYSKEESEELLSKYPNHKGKRQFTEEQRIERMSDSQLYKQAGNSIVTDVLYYIYLEIYKAMPYLFDDLKLTSLFSGIGAFEIALNRLYETINSENTFINNQSGLPNNNLIKLGNIYPSGGQNGNIYSETGISPTISSGTTNTKGNGGVGSNNAPKVLVNENFTQPQQK